jgi:hypothetical protein
MRFKRLHRGAQKGNAANYWSLFEPHYEQNLSANPKRTAKFFVLKFDAEKRNSFNKSFRPRKIFKRTSTNLSLKTRRMEYLKRQGAEANLLIFFLPFIFLVPVLDFPKSFRGRGGFMIKAKCP